MAKAVRLNELISTWLDTKSNLSGHIQVVDVDAGLMYSSEIQAKIHGLDVYDPYVCIAIIYDDRISFKLGGHWWPDAYRSENKSLLAADPQFFEKLEQDLLYYINL